MNKNHILKHIPSLLMLLGFLMLQSQPVWGQSEAQAAEEHESIQQPHEMPSSRPSKQLAQPSVPAQFPTLRAPSPGQHGVKSLLLERAMQRLTKAQKAKKEVNPTSIILFWLGLFFFVPSLAVMLLAFFLITDPFFLPVLLAIYITFGIFALAGLIFLLIALIYLLKGGGEDNGPVIIESEEVE